MKIVWNLMNIGGSISIYQDTNGLWKSDFEMPNLSINSNDVKSAREKSVRALKKYIVSLIKDLEKIQKIEEIVNETSRSGV